MTKHWHKEWAAYRSTLKFTIKNWFVCFVHSTFMIEFWTTIVLSVIRFSIVHHTHHTVAARPPDCPNVYVYIRIAYTHMWSTIIVYLSYITSNLFIFECDTSVFHINQHLFHSLLYYPIPNEFVVILIVFFCLFFVIFHIVIGVCLRCVYTRYLFQKAHFHFVLWYYSTKWPRQRHTIYMYIRTIYWYFADDFLHECIGYGHVPVPFQTTASRLFVVFLSFINLVKWTKCKHMEILYDI